MKGAILLFGAIGGLGVPVVFLLAAGVLRGFAPDSAVSLALLHGLQLPLWPMSKLILDDPSGKHWLYLPLAVVLSNALLYAIVGAASAWGRTNRGVYFALPVAVVGLQAIAAHGFGSDVIGYLLAAMFSVAGLVLYHRGYVR